jgi:hypothetical protein
MPDKFRANRSVHILGKALFDFLDEFHFATAGILAEHFNQSKPTIKETIQRELGLHRFSRRWIQHSLSDPRKIDPKMLATELLSAIRRQARHSFSWIITTDESWFYNGIQLIISFHRVGMK